MLCKCDEFLFCGACFGVRFGLGLANERSRYPVGGVATMTPNLYDKYGGFPAVSKVVHDFYRKVLDSELLTPYFENVDMPGLINHQIQFFSTLLGGPVSYDERQVDEIHKRLNITEAAFQEALDLLAEALEDAGFEGADRGSVIGVLETYREGFVHAGATGRDQ